MQYEIGIDPDLEGHTHDQFCLEYEPIEDYPHPDEPRHYRTGYVAYCSILDKEVTEDEEDDEDYDLYKDDEF